MWRSSVIWWRKCQNSSIRDTVRELYNQTSHVLHVSFEWRLRYSCLDNWPPTHVFPILSLKLMFEYPQYDISIHLHLPCTEWKDNCAVLPALSLRLQYGRKSVEATTERPLRHSFHGYLYCRCCHLPIGCCIIPSQVDIWTLQVSNWTFWLISADFVPMCGKAVSYRGCICLWRQVLELLLK